MDCPDVRVQKNVVIVIDEMLEKIELNVRQCTYSGRDRLDQRSNMKTLSYLKIIQWKESEKVSLLGRVVSGDSPAVKRLWREWDVLVLRDGALQTSIL
jgi:hypothetical protein